MSHRIPVSIASDLYAAICDAHPIVDWGALPADIMSDDERVNDVDALTFAELGYYRDPCGSDAIRMMEFIRDWRALDPTDVTMMVRWHGCRQVFDFDPTLVSALIETGAEDVPVEALRRLPYPIQFVRCAIGGYDGFLAWLDHDPQDGRVEVLAIDFLQRGSLRRWRYLVPLGMTVEGYVQKTVEEDEEYARDIQRCLERPVAVRFEDIPSIQRTGSPREVSDGLASVISGAVSLLLYVCSEEADVEVTYRPPRPGRGQRPGPRTNPETHVSVGARLGPALGEARKVNEGNRAPWDDSMAGCSRSVTPHIRRGHWQHYWVGPRKGRTDGRFGDELIVHWIPPVPVLGGDAMEVIHRASDEEER